MDQYGLIGYPLDHSFSKSYFEDKFRNEKVNANYHLFPITDLAGFKNLIETNPNLRGLNVTIPYKQQIIPLLDELDETAQEIQAVNCIRFQRNANGIRLVGFNTDAYGFQESLKSLANNLPDKALILGTGGASKAVSFVFDRLHIEHLFVSRKPHACKHIQYATLNKQLLDEFRFIVNTSPVGMYPNPLQFPDIPYDLLNENNLLYDLIYNPEETQFLKKGSASGAQIKNGMEMLHLQAGKSWQIWNS